MSSPTHTAKRGVTLRTAPVAAHTVWDVPPPARLHTRLQRAEKQLEALLAPAAGPAAICPGRRSELGAKRALCFGRKLKLSWTPRASSRLQIECVCVVSDFT